MTKKLLSLIMLATGISANAQNYPGFLQDNYSGIHGIMANPASIVDSRMKADISLASASFSANNDLLGINLFKWATDPNFSFTKDSKFFTNPNNNAIVFADAMGPGFMLNINPKHAIAVSSRARSIANFSNFNGELYNQFKDGTDGLDEGFDINVGSPIGVAHVWGELGATYAFVILDKKQHFLKGGLTAKYLQGGANGYLDTKDIRVKYTPEDPNIAGSEDTFYTNGSLLMGTNKDYLSDNSVSNFDTNSKGYGLDFGFVYEWRPDFEKYDVTKAKPADNNFKDLNKYKIRAGFSIRDLGSISYKNTTLYSFEINNQIFTKDDLDNAENLSDLFNYQKGTKDLIVHLPTAMHFDVDWHIHNKFYLNFNGNIGLTSKTSLNSSSINNTVMLTPRYETKWFSLFVPVNYNEVYDILQVGTGLRMGPVFIGSSSVITNLTQYSKAADVYLGFKIPIYHGHYTDTDGDGVHDKEDACPNLAGPVENKGCPWPDTDKDGVLDKDDKCPNDAGAKENDGCPWGDADGDGVLDNVDNCLTVAGPPENNGCPWPDTDNDGITDNIDKCPTVPGVASLDGCPEPVPVAPVVIALDSEEAKIIEKKLDSYTQTFEFYTGKATFKPGSTTGLDNVIALMNEYPTTNYNIDGHTDNVGNPASNKKLSSERAKSVREYLISKGIDPNRLKATGYGHTKPIASNKTPKGQALNRRVEINLAK
ncbi:MAG: DUF5723 family protein [Flavobacterium sp.]